MIVLILLAISLSVDAFTVAFSHGINNIKIPLASKITICLFSVFYFGISVKIGAQISEYITPTASEIIGLLFLAGIFVYMFFQTIGGESSSKKPPKKPQAKEVKTLLQFTLRSIGLTFKIVKNPLLCDIDNSKSISIGEAILLGTALSIDSIGAGVGYSLSYKNNIISAVMAALVVGLFQLIFLSIGNYIGFRAKKSEKHAKRIKFLPCILIFSIIIMRIIKL